MGVRSHLRTCLLKIVLLVLILLIGFADRIYARCAHKEQSASAPSGDGFGQPRVNFRQADALDCKMEIPLTNGGVALIDDSDYPIVESLLWHWWTQPPRNLTKYAIASRWENGVRFHFRMHRLIIGVTDRRIPVDHRNRNGLDNRRENIRIATPTQSAANVGLRRNSLSGYKGVTWHKGDCEWHARIRCNNVVYFLGAFTDRIEAALAYDKAAVELFGEFAYLNFPILPQPFIAQP